MIKLIAKHTFFLLQCDKCGLNDSVTSISKTQQQVKQVATRWRWAFDTEHGDLCPKCAKMQPIG